MLDVSDLKCGYTDIPVVKGMSFSVPSGNLCALFGPNGCGKTTLFKSCLKFIPKLGGKIQVNGKEISTYSVSELACSVAYVPQEHKPPFPFTVHEIVLMGRTPHQSGFFRAKKVHLDMVSDALERVGISNLADLPYNRLSGGQRQLVLIARALAQDTPLLLLDEPTSALDFSNQLRIWKILRNIADSGKTVFACSHDPNHVLWFCDSVIVMKNGAVLTSGDPYDVINQDTIHELYDDLCSVPELSGTRVVMPGEIPRKMCGN
nr:ABC transporter ATP-binding protein [uncultured Methanospirillum sp.]